MVTYNTKKFLMGRGMNNKPFTREDNQNYSTTIVPYGRNFPMYGSNGSVPNNLLFQNNQNLILTESAISTRSEVIKDASRNYYAPNIYFVLSDYDGEVSQDVQWGGGGYNMAYCFELLSKSVVQGLEGEILKTIYTFTVKAIRGPLTIKSILLYKTIVLDATQHSDTYLVAYEKLSSPINMNIGEIQTFTMELQL